MLHQREVKEEERIVGGDVPGLEESLPAVVETTTLEVGPGQVEKDLGAVKVEELPQAVLILCEWVWCTCG